MQEKILGIQSLYFNFLLIYSVTQFKLQLMEPKKMRSLSIRKAETLSQRCHHTREILSMRSCIKKQEKKCQFIITAKIATISAGLKRCPYSAWNTDPRQALGKIYLLRV